MTMALPHGEPLAPSEEGAEETQELASVDNPHAEAVREWKENYANGAVYSQLQEYLSEGQQEEVYDIVRMSLTAWQLQFNPKNIAFIFDALWNASGKLAMLLEIARRKKIERDAGTSCEGISISPVESAESAIAEQSGEINLQQAPLAVPELRESMAPEGGERSAPANIAGVAAELSADAFAEEVRTPSRERIAAPRSRSSAVIAPEILGASRWSFVEKFEEKTLDEIPYFGFRGFRRRAPKSKIEESPRAVEESPAEDLESEKSAKKGIGLRVAAIVFLVVGFSVGFTVGLNTPAVPPETEEPRPESPTSTAQPAVLAPVSPASSTTLVKPTGPSTAVSSPSHADSDRSSGAPIRNEATAEERESRESPRDANSFARVPSREPDAAPATESRRTSELARGSERDSPSGLDARNAWPPARSESAYTREGGREFRERRGVRRRVSRTVRERYVERYDEKRCKNRDEKCRGAKGELCDANGASCGSVCAIDFCNSCYCAGPGQPVSQADFSGKTDRGVLVFRNYVATFRTGGTRAWTCSGSPSRSIASRQTRVLRVASLPEGWKPGGIERNCKVAGHDREVRASDGRKARERLEFSFCCGNERDSPVAFSADPLERTSGAIAAGRDD